MRPGFTRGSRPRAGATDGREGVQACSLRVDMPSQRRPELTVASARLRADLVTGAEGSEL